MKKEFLILLQTTTNPEDNVVFDMFVSSSNGIGVIFEQINFVHQSGLLPTIFTEITSLEKVSNKQQLMELLNSKRTITNTNSLLLKEGQAYNSIQEVIDILVAEYEKLVVWEIVLDESTRDKMKVEIFNSL